MNQDSPNLTVWEKLSFAKRSQNLREIFVGSDIKKIIQYPAFSSSLNVVEKEVWSSFVAGTENF